MLTLDQVQLKSVMPNFTQIGQNPKEEFEKVAYAYVAI